MTAGTAAFSRLLLDATKEAVRLRRRAEPISNLTSALLLEQALDSSPKLKDEAGFYLEVSKACTRGGVSSSSRREIRKLRKGRAQRPRAQCHSEPLRYHQCKKTERDHQ